MTTRIDHTVSVDGISDTSDIIRIDDDDTITKLVGHHSHLATGATHTLMSV